MGGVRILVGIGGVRGRRAAAGRGARVAARRRQAAAAGPVPVADSDHASPVAGRHRAVRAVPQWHPGT